jgi:medium-chain acyl-[acyl-carrier-protein] hydrolase
MHEPPFRRIEPLVDSLVEAITPLLDLPFALFGHSMGALVSFELAHALKQRRGVMPRQLFVSGMTPPHRQSNENLHLLSDDAFKRELHELNGTPREILEHPELMSLVLPRLRADFETCETYHYVEREPLDCPIIALGGLSDEEAPREELMQWRSLTRGHFMLQMFPGDHFYLETARAPLIETVSQILSHQLRTHLGSS